MKTYKLAFLFTQPPFGSSVSREGLDALLAASAFCDEDDIAICFIDDGVFNLLAHQTPNLILQKDHIAAFKLIELYDLKHCFICQPSVLDRQLEQCDWILSAPIFLDRPQIHDVLQRAEKILTF
ncbi:sulfur relay protein TusC [[Actinobacillus] muris]|uniref:Sulfur relay protein TusC n=1 Tax=Muribacter muris TaxID=67855 RepID=A0A0J5P4V2_9PAST|nr:sulfurtransferase complex subunit TusC [Muribacter muris]KMK51301.1 sulfur relay protein TusC [[Actinobacillus] muris] [Muribacter muris]